MKEKINTNINAQGETNVKSSDTILRTTNMVDMGRADVARSGKGDWNSFELMNESNREEKQWQSGREADEEAFERRLETSSVGRKILMLSS